MSAPQHGSDSTRGRDDEVAQAPALDSLDDELMRRRIHARLFPADEETSERAGVWIDHFELLEKLGAGGMGSVWIAQDHRLQRQVALKFLRERDGGDGRGTQRLVREAQALARMQHPNVVAVYDIGQHAGRDWIAMELVPGQTLRSWAGARAPLASELLDVWIAAGRGLAAIHACGLVHRDVKPDNLLLGDDGRVRVIDFGLVRAVDASIGVASTQRESSHDSQANEDMVGQLITRRAHFVGTPGYAAPEQLAGRRVDARADQYAFCVGLWEALSGERPTPAGKPLSEGIEPRVRAALLRGLAIDPHARFTSMGALLDALEPRPARRWLTGLGVAAALTAVVGAASLLVVPSPCAGAGAAIEAQWGESERAQLLQLLAARPELAAFTHAALDDWSSRWRAAARHSCEQLDTQRPRPATPPERGRCLERQRRQFGVVIEGLEQLAVASQTSSAGARLAQLVSELRDPATCLLTPPEPGETLELSRARQREQLELSMLRAAYIAHGRSVEGRRAQLEGVLERARSQGFRGLEAWAAYYLGVLARSAQELDSARDHFGRVMDLAGDPGNQQLHSFARIRLAQLELDEGLALERARWHAERAEAELAELGHASVAGAKLELLWGDIHAASARPELALESFARAEQIFAQLGPAQSFNRAAALRKRAITLDRSGKGDAAEPLYVEADALELRAPQSDAESASARLRAVSRLLAQARYEDARTQLEVLAAPLEREQGEQSPDMAQYHQLAAELALSQGQLDDAREHAGRSDAIICARLGPSSPQRVYPLNTLATIAFHERDFAEAARAYGLNLSIAKLSFAPESLERASIELNLAETYLAQGRLEQSEPLLRRAIERLSEGAPPVYLAIALGVRAKLLRRRGEFAAALVELERGLALFAAGAEPSLDQAELLWLRAQLLADADDPAAALAAAASATTAFRALGELGGERLAQIDTWKTELGNPGSSTSENREHDGAKSHN